MDKVICVGKNYLKHAREMGDQDVPREPVYFFKPPSSVMAVNQSAELALSRNSEVHHEVELVFKLKSEDGALRFSHYTFGLDLTLRAIQTQLKNSGLPWEKSKVFKNAAVIGRWLPIASLEEVLSLPFELAVNGKSKQTGIGREMHFQPQHLLQDLERWFPLCDGDLLFTGTPDGVGPVHVGDRLRVHGGAIDYSLTCI